MAGLQHKHGGSVPPPRLARKWAPYGVGQHFAGIGSILAQSPLDAWQAGALEGLETWTITDN